MADKSQVIMTVGLGNGDEGKGKVVGYLAETLPVHTVVRYNGASNAHHNGVTKDGREHAFQQFGSGSFTPGVRTHLSRFMLVNPVAFIPEGEHLIRLGVTDIFSRVTVERDALVTTPFQIAMNRLREMSRGQGRHGSCGLGVFETFHDNLEQGDSVMFVRDLEDPNVMARKLRFIQELNRDKALRLPGIPDDDYARLMLDVLNDPAEVGHSAEWFNRFIKLVTPVDDTYLAEVLRCDGVTVFEGAQGALLDEEHGFFPHCTPSNTLLGNAYKLLAQVGFNGDVKRIGITRTYATRHGAGPFMTEDRTLDPAKYPEPHNRRDAWQEDFRLGRLDPIAIRYALEAIGGVDGIALTHVDRLDGEESVPVCAGYTASEPDEELFDVRGNRIVGIKHEANPSLARQERITRQLTSVRPVYEAWSSEPKTFIERLEDTLRTPITIFSTGPMAQQTQERPLKESVAA